MFERASAALGRAQSALLARQAPSGLWHDFNLPPGQSDAWTTAYVGCALLRLPAAIDCNDLHLTTASAAIVRLRRQAGWGYNLSTACDGDSTAWAIRFLCPTSLLPQEQVRSLLSRFLTQEGRALTFVSSDRFGSWANVHAEVTPAVGLALAAVGLDADAKKVRSAVLRDGRDQGWQAFWWDTPSYALAANLEFLDATGGIPDDIAERACPALAHAPTSSLECAFLLSAASLLEHACAPRLARQLLDLQRDDGLWPPSWVLRVPDQWDPSHGTVHADEQCLFGTAAASAAIKTYLRCPCILTAAPLGSARAAPASGS